ncbi:MAG: efflux RND transporter periplasmic adaptor subunit [Bacteroidota bacterium]
MFVAKSIQNLELAALQSGYRQAQLDLEKASYQLSLTKLRAPFTGVVANLQAQPFQPSQDHRPLCLLQDLRPMEVRFSILETELGLLQTGNSLQIEPLAQLGQSYPARLLTINPHVNENGLVEIVAQVDQPGRQLLPGMNVRVRLRQAVPEQLIVPREAVVLRQGRPVVFVYRSDTAYWNYVQPDLENSQFYTLSEGIQADEIVIISGNLNLAHLAPVQIQ